MSTISNALSFAQPGLHLRTYNSAGVNKLTVGGRACECSPNPAPGNHLLTTWALPNDAQDASITIVSPRTFLRWVNGETAVGKPAKRGRPRTAEEIRQIVLTMAREAGWGYTRILGELKKLGIKVAPNTVKRILLDNGFDIGPKRGDGTCYEFLRIHAKTLWACDFLSKKVWAKRGLVDIFILFFIHIQTRRVYVSG